MMLAFDDTPGFSDTIHSDRAKNSALMRKYKEKYFPDPTPGDSFPSDACCQRKTYPNAILLIASWDSIKVDAHNKPHQFTSAVGMSMYNLSTSGLVDDNHANVVVVITKSLSFPSQFEDFETEEEKNIQWNVEAGKREDIIIDVQRKVFPNLKPWQIVFVENGGSSDMGAMFPYLPNGQLSHQNLFEAIRTIIEEPGRDGSIDFAGIHALDVLTGAEPLNPNRPVEKQTLLKQSDITNLISVSINHYLLVFL
jgi:hypothetical protein